VTEHVETGTLIRETYKCLRYPDLGTKNILMDVIIFLKIHGQ